MSKPAWKTHDPQGSPFDAVAGVSREYVVHTLTVESADEAEIQAAVTESVAQMCRLAEANVSERTEIVLFEWDSVYSQLMVVYTNRARDFDARDVLKVLCTGWDKETFDLEEDDQLDMWGEREELVRTWVRRALQLPEAQATLAMLAKRDVVPVYTAEVNATEFDPL